MSRRLNARLEALEQHAGGRVDLASERALYGEPLWGAPDGRRCYLRVNEHGSRLTLAGGPHPPLVHELVGVDVRDLV